MPVMWMSMGHKLTTVLTMVKMVADVTSIPDDVTFILLKQKDVTGDAEIILGCYCIAAKVHTSPDP